MQKIKFLILITIILPNLNMIAETKKDTKREPKVLWTQELEKDYRCLPMDQDMSSDFLSVIKESGKRDKKSVCTVKFDFRGQTREEEVPVDNDYEPFISEGSSYDLYSFKNGSVLLKYSDRVEYYSPDDKLIFSEEIDTKIDKVYLDAKNNNILIDYHTDVTERSITAFSALDGEVAYEIDYKVSNLKHSGMFYFGDNRIVIYEKGNSLALYNMKDGKLVNRIDDFASKLSKFNFFENKESGDLYMLSINPGYICFVNFETGRLISKIAYKSKSLSGLERLDQIEIKKINDLYFIMINSDLKSEKSIVCIDSMSSSVLWEKRVDRNGTLSFFDKEKMIIVNDNELVYGIDKKSGEEIWVSKRSKNMSQVFNTDTLTVVSYNKNKSIDGYDNSTGALKWTLKQKNGYVDPIMIKDKFLLVSGDNSIQKIDIQNGTTIWKADDFHGVSRLIYEEESNKIIVFSAGGECVSEIDIESGRTNWDLVADNSMIYTREIIKNKDVYYFANESKLYGINVATGKTVLDVSIPASNKIRGFEYIKNKDLFVFIDTKRRLYIYNPKKNTLSDEIKLKESSSMILEIRSVGKYLMVVEIVPAQIVYTRYGSYTANSFNYLSLIDIEKEERLYSIPIGYHDFTYIRDYSYFYDITGGTYYDKGSMGEKLSLLFFPRKELFKENVVIVHKILPGETKKIIGYEMFPDGRVSDKEIKDIEAHLINLYYGTYE